MRDKTVIPADGHVAKIKAACRARGKEHRETFMITARTDARGPMGLEEAIRRGKMYKDAGADMIFIEAPESVEEIKRIAKEVPGPLVMNCIDGGKTPILSLEDLHELGYMSVGFVLTGLFASARATLNAYRTVLKQGSSRSVNLMPFDDFTEILGLERYFALDESLR